MKHFIFLLTPALLLAETYQIDAAHSQANFSVRHMMVTNVRGTMGKVTGTIDFNDKDVAASKVTATVDVLGVSTNEPKRDEHLKSPDFFDAAKFAKIEFTSTKWWREGDRVKVTGNLTMHGVTKPVTLDVEVNPAVKDAYGNMRIGAVATGKIKRSDWGLSWNKALEAGGVAVSDEVQVTLDISAVRKA